jgi:hypothetical protein
MLPDMQRRLADEPLLLPPGFTAVHHSDPADVFRHAEAIAAQTGAATLVYGEDDRTLAFAVILEPEEPLSAARLAFFTAMAATGDALAVHCAPERSLLFQWPDVILYDLARLGGARLGWPEACAETEVPEWLVFGVELIADRPGIEPGAYLDSTSLVEEEFDDSPSVIESFARNLMRLFDVWREQGVQEATRGYLGRLERREPDALLSLTETGDLLARSPSGPAGQSRMALLPALAERRWRDDARAGPRL